MHDLIIRNARIADGTGQAAFQGDVAIHGATIAEVTRERRIAAQARREIDADGDLLIPGFVDIHTHYDGQVCWDRQLTPSCWHGVTTVVTGNCGVGFAPVRPGTEGELVEIMESVEDIPGAVLHEGVPWTWETFPEYLDAIDGQYAVDVGTQVPHVALRHYVMGDRCYGDAAPEDMAQMRRLTREALQAGAMGFSTSRFYGHLDKRGELVPGTHATADELLTISEAFKGLDHGTIELITDDLEDDEELAWMEQIARSTGRPLTVLVTSAVEKVWSLAERLDRDGFTLRPQVGARPASVLMSLEGTINPMRQYPAYREIHGRPVAERRAALRDSEFRRRILNEEPILPRNPDGVRFMTQFDEIYVMDAALSYEPGPDETVAAISRARGVEPIEVIMDTLADDVPLLFFFRGYLNDLEAQRHRIEHPLSVFGLSDGGAHCGALVDASVPTYMLSYFTRDRRRGPLMQLEQVVHKLTQDTARVYGMLDRGVVAAGYRADLNLIRYDELKLQQPHIAYDLPGGGKRLVQGADGYRATWCAGEITYENGEHTGALPGRLMRGSQRIAA